MCSIMGYCEEGEVLKTFRECFLRTSSRGPDECRILDTGKGYLGFQRLAIMGLTPSGMQPFSLNGTVIDNTRELRIQHTEHLCSVLLI